MSNREKIIRPKSWGDFGQALKKLGIKGPKTNNLSWKKSFNPYKQKVKDVKFSNTLFSKPIDKSNLIP